MLLDMLLLTSDGQPKSGGIYTMESSDYGVVRINSSFDEAKITSLSLSGGAEADPYSKSGYLDSEGRWCLDVRIHRESFLDGPELIRLMNVSGATVYGGELNDTHFLYLCDTEKSSTVVKSDHLLLPRTAMRLKMTATLSDDVKNGGALIPGLHIANKHSSPIALRAQKSGIGDVEMTATTSYGTVFTGLIHKAVNEYMKLPIITDSVRLAETSFASPPAYEGRTTVFHIGEPLLVGTEEYSDELDCVGGRVIRRVGAAVIGEDVELEEVSYQGTPCYRICLPESIGSASVCIDGLYDVTENPWAFSEDDYVFITDAERGHIYVRLLDAEDLEGACDMLYGVRMVYPLREERITELKERIDTSLGEGRFYVEACSSNYPTVKAEYTQKE